MESWDVVIVGSGPAALRAAIAAADAGTIPLTVSYTQLTQPTERIV